MKTSIILSARKERDSSVPYPLKSSLGGCCLLDRTLAMLRQAHYRHIVIVVGFKAEMFEQYKADDITLVYNPDFESTSSMGSLACCRNIVDDDFLLVEGDTYFERTIIDRLSLIDKGNCFAITDESGSGDECYVETSHGFLYKLTKDIHQVRRFEGEMIGVSRITLSTFDLLCEEWQRADNPYLNYEYLIMDVLPLVERPFIRFKNVIWGDIDCDDDFRRFQDNIARKLQRKENPFDRENLYQYLQDIFLTEEVTHAVIERMGGMSNKNYKITYRDQSYVLRVPGNGAGGMVERNNEAFNAQQACNLGVNPQIKYFNNDTGIKLVDYIENSETLNASSIQHRTNLTQIVKIFQAVHNSHVRFKNEFNIFEEINRYDELIRLAGAQMYAGWQNIRPQVMALEERLNILGVDVKPCHNDVVPENFIKSSDNSIYLIDWEYSGMNDPIADIAALFLESQFSKDNEDFFLKHYFNNNIPDNIFEKIMIYQILWDYLWSQWTVVKEAKGDDFGAYGFERYNRSIMNLKRLGGEKQ